MVRPSFFFIATCRINSYNKKKVGGGICLPAKETEKENLMKKWKMKAALLFAILTLSAGAATVQADEQPETELETEAETEVLEGLQKEGKKYYFYSKGEKITNKWKTIGKKTYYFGEDGAAITGWKTLKKGSTYKYFYFNSKGVMTKSKKLNQNLVKLTDKAIKASGASKATGKTALKKIFNYMKKNYNYYGLAQTKFKNGYSGWDVDFAVDMLRDKKGCCYNYAAAYAYAAKRATGYTTRICWGTSQILTKGKWQNHGWVEIKIGSTWYTFDVNAAKFSNYAKNKAYLKKSSSVKKYYKATKKVEVKI